MIETDFLKCAKDITVSAVTNLEFYKHCSTNEERINLICNLLKETYETINTIHKTK